MHFSLSLIKYRFNSTVQRTALQDKNPNNNCHFPYGNKFTICTSTYTLPVHALQERTLSELEKKKVQMTTTKIYYYIIFFFIKSVWFVSRLKILQAFNSSKTLISLSKIM